MIAYLASPYTDKFDRAMQEYRYHLVMEAVAAFLRDGHFVYSPIAHCHEIAKRFALPTDAMTWKQYNEEFIMAFSQVWVLAISGWSTSVGVTMEIAFAHNHNIPVRYWLCVEGKMVEVNETIAYNRDNITTPRRSSAGPSR